VSAVAAALAVGLAAIAGAWAGHRATETGTPQPQHAVVRVGAARLMLSPEWRAVGLRSARIDGLSAGRALAFALSPGPGGPAVVHRLDRERAAQRGALQRAATARGQALAARRLAAAYADAAAALRRVAGAPGASLIEHLAGVRRAYGALARAAAAGSVGAFA